MGVRHIDGAGAEHDLLRVVREAGEEHETRGDVLREVGDVLADQRLDVAELIREQDRLAVLDIGLVRLPRRRMQRHHESAKAH